MIIEFSGGAGGGKSTLVAASIKECRRRHIPVMPVRRAAGKGLREVSQFMPLLERVDGTSKTYGAVHYGQQFPDIFRLLTAHPDSLPIETVWNMIMMSELFFATRKLQKGQVIFCEEGFVQRAAVYFDQEKDVLEEYIRGLDDRLALIHVDIPHDVAIERMRARPKGIPQKFRKNLDEALMNQRNDLGHICQLWEDQGRSLLKLDGREPIAANCERICDFIIKTIASR